MIRRGSKDSRNSAIIHLFLTFYCDQDAKTFTVIKHPPAYGFRIINYETLIHQLALRLHFIFASH